MRPQLLFAEGLRATWAQKVPSALTVIVVALMCLTALSTVGRATANDRELAASLDGAGARLLTVTDGGGLGVVSSAVLGVVQQIEGVELAVALSSPKDVHNGVVSGGAPVPLWEISDVSAVVSVQDGRVPRPGEGTINAEIQQKLSLAHPAGFVEARDQSQYPIVSGATVLAGFEDLEAGVLVQGYESTSYTQLRVVIADVQEVPSVQRAVLSAFGPVDPTKLTVESPQALNVVSELVHGQLSRYNQSLLAMIMGVGALFIAIVVFSDVLLHRRDLGRRRALGATRADLSMLTVVRTMIPAAMGAILGTAAASIIFLARDIVLPWDLTVAIGWLAVVTSGLAAAAPAIWASMRDPVSVLRTP